MKSIKSFSFYKLFSNNKFNMAFSIILAFILWLVITIDQNPIIEQTVTKVPVIISVDGTATSELGLDIISEYPSTASVTVSGPSYVVSSLKAENIRVTADTSSINTPGEYTFNLYASKVSGKTEYSFASINPSSVTLSFDYIDEKKFTVVPEVVGVSASSGLIVDKFIVSDSKNATVSVKGTRTAMDKLATVMAYAESNEILSETKSYPAELRFLSADGSILNPDDYVVSVDKLYVTVPVYKKKSLPVVITYSDVPAGFNTSGAFSATMSVNRVTVFGPSDTVDSLTAVNLLPISFNDISPDNHEFDMNLSLPNGVKTNDDVSSISVDLNLGDYALKTFSLDSSSVKFINVPSGITQKTASGVKVKICGPAKTVNKLTNKDISIEVDLSGKLSGAYKVNAVVVCGKYQKIWQVGNSTVDVTLK